jgi:tetratricopeptide (TPR) repeat protein
VCPRDYSLNIEYVLGLRPRWGGSYPEMRSATEAARRRGLDALHLGRLEAQVTIDQASLLVSAEKLDEALDTLTQAINLSPTGILFQERARLNDRLKDAPATLRDANAALELGNGGWNCSRGGLGRLLLYRTRALRALGRNREAGADIALAIEVAPTDESVKLLAMLLPLLNRSRPEGAVPAVP